MKRTLSLLITAVMLCGILLVSVSALEIPFSDLTFTQVYDYASMSNTVVLKANYKNTGFSNVKFAVKEVTKEDVPQDYSSLSYRGDYIGFNIDVGPEVAETFKVKVEVTYLMDGQTFGSTEEISVSLKAALDKSDLTALIAEANKKLSMRYNEASFKTFTQVKEAAIKFANDPKEQDPAQYKQMCTDLEYATENLERAAEGFMDTIYMIIEMFIGLISSAFGLDAGGLF